MTLNGHQKKWHFPKTDSCNENAHLFFTFRTQIVLAYFLKKDNFTKKKPFFFTTSFCNFIFPFFSCFLLFHFQHKIDKNKKCTFFFEKKTLFWHPDKLPKNIFAPLHTICVFKIPKKHYKTGETSKKILDQVLTQPWTKFWFKKPQILDQVLTLQHIYIYMRCKVQNWSKISFFIS